MSLNEVVSESVSAYKPMLDKLGLASKIEMYGAIYNNLDTATSEMLSLGVAITADPEFQQWMNLRLHQPQLTKL